MAVALFSLPSCGAESRQNPITQPSPPTNSQTINYPCTPILNGKIYCKDGTITVTTDPKTGRLLFTGPNKSFPAAEFPQGSNTLLVPSKDINCDFVIRRNNPNTNTNINTTENCLPSQ